MYANTIEGMEVRQQQHEYSCGPTCAHAVINYLLERAGIPLQKTLRQVERELPSWPTGILPATIGVWGIRKGCNAALWISQDSYNMMSTREWPNWTNKVLQFAKLGGSIHLNTAERFLHWAFTTRRGPMIAEVDDGVLHNDDGEGHYVVVTGVNKGKVEGQDPYYDSKRKRCFSVPIKRFLKAVEETDGSLLSLTNTPAMLMCFTAGAM